MRPRACRAAPRSRATQQRTLQMTSSPSGSLPAVLAPSRALSAILRTSFGSAMLMSTPSLNRPASRLICGPKAARYTGMLRPDGLNASLKPRAR